MRRMLGLAITAAALATGCSRPNASGSDPRGFEQKSTPLAFVEPEPRVPPLLRSPSWDDFTREEIEQARAKASEASDKARREMIAELQTIEDAPNDPNPLHRLSGGYRGTINSWLISPSGRVALSSGSCLPSVAQIGRITEVDPPRFRVVFDPTPPAAQVGESTLDEVELYAMQLLGKSVLATREMLNEYVDACNRGEPCERELRNFYLRVDATDTDEAEFWSHRRGIPDLPAEFAGRLRHEPITLTVLKSAAQPRDGEAGANPAVFDVVLDRGSDDGIYRGMTLNEDSATRTQRGIVWEVMPTRSRARIWVHRFLVKDDPPIRSGTTFRLTGVRP